MNIFEGLKVGHPWEVSNVRALTPEEKSIIVSAKVVPSQFGYSLEITTNEEVTTIPISTRVEPVEGEYIDVNDIKLLTLRKDNETLYRVEW